MKRFVVLSALLLLLALSCRESRHEMRWDEIERTIRTSPDAALAMLDDIADSVRFGSERDKMKYALLRIKAEDKAYLPHRSDSAMKRVLAYFKQYGTEEERLEAFYYMGCTYRDMHNTPDALRWYRRASDYGDEHIARVDTDMLACVNAQLSLLLARQRNYRQAFECLQRNYRYMEGTKRNNEYVYEMASGYDMLFGNEPSRVEYRDSASYFFTLMMEKFEAGDTAGVDLSHFCEGLVFFATNGDTMNARKWKTFVEGHSWAKDAPNRNVAYGYFYQMEGRLDSTAYYWEKAYEESPDDVFRRDAAAYLYKTYKALGQTEQLLPLAETYMETNDSITLRYMSDLTIDANNEYRYQRDREAEERVKAEARLMILVGVIMVAWSLMSVIYVMYRRKMRLATLMRRNARLLLEREEMVHESQSLQTIIKNQAETIGEFEKENETRMEEEKKRLGAAKRLDIANTEVAIYFHNAADAGVVQIPEERWEELRHTVDRVFPEFLPYVLRTYDAIETEHLQILYMLRLGLKTGEVSVLLGKKPSAVSHLRERLRKKLGRMDDLL